MRHSSNKPDNHKAALSDRYRTLLIPCLYRLSSPISLFLSSLHPLTPSITAAIHETHPRRPEGGAEEKTLKPILNINKEPIDTSQGPFCAVWAKKQHRTSTEGHTYRRGERCTGYYRTRQTSFTWSSMSRMSRVTTMLTAFPRLESWNSLATWPPKKQEKTSLKNSWFSKQTLETRAEEQTQDSVEYKDFHTRRIQEERPVTTKLRRGGHTDSVQMVVKSLLGTCQSLLKG